MDIFALPRLPREDVGPLMLKKSSGKNLWPK